jgi:small nuclear ribonucleoprotein (snRNP)-like protein
MSENQEISMNFTNYLKTLLSKEITLDLREANLRLKGILRNFDQYSNLLLSNVVEFEKSPDGTYIEITQYTGNVLVRGDSIHNIIPETV